MKGLNWDLQPFSCQKECYGFCLNNAQISEWEFHFGFLYSLFICLLIPMILWFT